MTTPSLDALPAFSLSSCLLPMNINPAPPNMTTAAGGASILPTLKFLLGGALPPPPELDEKECDEEDDDAVAWRARRRRCILVVWFMVRICRHLGLVWNINWMAFVSTRCCNVVGAKQQLSIR